MKTVFITCLLTVGLMPLKSLCQSTPEYTESVITLETASGNIHGTLTIPDQQKKVPACLIISGSGPTDRNGNNQMMTNNSLQMLAHGLAANGIASIRFDKRGVAASAEALEDETRLRFDHYVDDAKAWIDLLRNDDRFSKIFVLGHSEGSLIGMLAAKNNADGFVSIAGAGRAADELLREQLGKQPPMVQEMCFPILDSLKEGKTVLMVNPMLYSLFRPSVQPYLINWFSYDPQVVIQSLSQPIMIIQGTSDLQVTETDADLLKKGNPKAELVLIENMNHVLKIVEGDMGENLATYNEPDLPVSPELIEKLTAFILKQSGKK